MSDRIPYRDLFPDEQEGIHAWLREHRIEPGRVPVYAQLERDDTTSEWRIPLFWVDERGRKHINPDGESVRMVVVRRRELSPLPWPRVALRLGPVTSISIDVTSYVSGIELAGQQLAVLQSGGVITEPVRREGGGPWPA